MLLYSNMKMILKEMLVSHPKICSKTCLYCVLSIFVYFCRVAIIVSPYLKFCHLVFIQHVSVVCFLLYFVSTSFVLFLINIFFFYLTLKTAEFQSCVSFSLFLLSNISCSLPGQVSLLLTGELSKDVPLPTIPCRVLSIMQQSRLLEDSLMRGCHVTSVSHYTVLPPKTIHTKPKFLNFETKKK